jgi:hypothetical protein
MIGLTKEEYIERFVKYMCEHAGFTHFDPDEDGARTPVVDYARDTAEASWGCRCPDETPEDDAQSDMDYWGEG